MGGRDICFINFFMIYKKEKGMDNTVIYKGIEVPAKMVKFSNGPSKLMPISTNRYTLHGIPKPRNLDVTSKITQTAKEIIKADTKIAKAQKNILARYIRKGTMDGLVLKRKHDKKGIPEYFVSKGTPVGLIVGFIYYNKLRIGWSKRLNGKVEINGKFERREPLVFTKKDAMLLAVERGLSDTITFRNSIVRTKEGIIIPKVVVNNLIKFIKRCESYFRRTASNVKW